jgi:hypothetical protein
VFFAKRFVHVDTDVDLGFVDTGVDTSNSTESTVLVLFQGS